MRARDLSIRASQPGDFLNWAFRQLDQGENQAGLHEALAHTFLPRQLFGEYVRQRLYESVAQRPDVVFSVVNDTAKSCVTESGRYRIGLERNAPVIADVLFLATAYGLSSTSAEGALKPFESVAPDRLAAARQIALIGSGLTMVDVLLAARRDGFHGTALVVSRRGQLPRPHAPKGVVPKEIGLPRSKRVSLLAAAIRISCEMAEESGTPWQAVINGLRPSLPDIWQALPTDEQARFLRHLRPFWDSHRHRLPMEVHSRLMAEFAEGRAILLHGSVQALARDAGGFKLTLLSRGSREPSLVEADLAFDCTGFRPDLDQPLIASLFERDLARPDAHRLGLAVGRQWASDRRERCVLRPVRHRPALPGHPLGDHRRPRDRGPGRPCRADACSFARGGGGNDANPRGRLLVTIGAGVNLSLWLTVSSPQKATKRRKINMFPAGRKARGR